VKIGVHKLELRNDEIDLCILSMTTTTATGLLVQISCLRLVALLLTSSRTSHLSAPLDVKRAGLVSQAVADEVDISSVDQYLNASLEHISNVSIVIDHPVASEVSVDVVVAGHPGGSVRSNVKGLPCRVGGEPLLDVGEVVAERVVPTLLADVVGVQPSAVIRSGQLSVAVAVRSIAIGTALIVAHLNLVNAKRGGLHHFLMGALVNALDSVAVVVGHLSVVLVLDLGLGQTISDSNSGCEVRRGTVRPVRIRKASALLPEPKNIK